MSAFNVREAGTESRFSARFRVSPPGVRARHLPPRGRTKSRAAGSLDDPQARPHTVSGVAVVEHLIPENEQARLEAVRRYGILDTPPDGAFDRITRIAAAILDVPISILSIVDHDRIWFKSTQGFDGVEQIGRDPGLCASAILSDTTWVVNDAKVDPRTLANPLVAGGFGLQFYAGSALRTHDGYKLGTLCVIDRNPRELTDEQARMLDDLAAVVVDELELR